MKSSSQSSNLHSTLESRCERFKIAGFFDEVPPLAESYWSFVMLEHCFGVVNKVRDVLLHGSRDESNEQTWIFRVLPLWKFQEGVESTAVCHAVTLFVHQEGLCLRLTSYNSKNIPDLSLYKYYQHNPKVTAIISQFETALNLFSKIMNKIIISRLIIITYGHRFDQRWQNCKPWLPQNQILKLLSTNSHQSNSYLNIALLFPQPQDWC